VSIVRISADRLARSRWRRSRRAAHQCLTKSAVLDYHNVLCKEGVLLASALLADPGAPEKHFKRTAASATMSIVYDYPTLETDNEKNVKQIFAFADRISESAAPGAYLVELFPWMLYIPERSVLKSMRYFSSSLVRPCFRFAKWKSEGNRSFSQFNTLFESLFNRVRSDLVGLCADAISRILLNQVYSLRVPNDQV
jgi:hypothetical protein